MKELQYNKNRTISKPSSWSTTRYYTNVTGTQRMIFIVYFDK